MRWINSLLVFTAFAATLSAQPPRSAAPAAPRPLPPSVQTAPPVSGPGLIHFDPDKLTLKRSENRYQLWADNHLLKDLGPTEREAHEALRTVRELHFNQYGMVPGAVPPFEYWLSDNESTRGGLSVKNAIPFNPQTLKAEKVAGAWVLHDDKLVLYNFGVHEDGAVQALELIKKHGFNEMGIVGVPSPTMTYLTIDPHRHKDPSRGQLGPREIIYKVSEQGLVLPGLGYVGGKIPIERRKLEAVKLSDGWAVVQGKDVIARFGTNMIQARDCLRVLQESGVTDVCPIGKSGFPIYLCNGRPLDRAGLGFNNVRLQPDTMSVRIINDIACILQNDRIVFEFGPDKTDAEQFILVLKHFQFNQYCVIGDAANGGFRLLLHVK